jgi:hypothetical protein
MCSLGGIVFVGVVHALLLSSFADLSTINVWGIGTFTTATCMQRQIIHLISIICSEGPTPEYHELYDASRSKAQFHEFRRDTNLNLRNFV